MEGIIGKITSIPDEVYLKEKDDGKIRVEIYKTDTFTMHRNYVVIGMVVFRPPGATTLPAYLLIDDEGIIVLRAASLFKLKHYSRL